MYTNAKKEQNIKKQKTKKNLPSLKQIHIVELVELHSELHCDLDFSHLGIYRQRCLTSSGIHLIA